MSHHPVRVLAVSPGVRWTGVAVIEEGALVRFDVITTRRYFGNSVPLRVKLDRLVEESRPDLAVVEVPNFRREGKGTSGILGIAVRVLQARGVPLRRTTLMLARRHLVAPAPATRATVHHTLVTRFPQLARSTKSRPGSRWWSDTDRYWERAFAALTLAVDAVQEVGSGVRETSMHAGFVTE